MNKIGFGIFCFGDDYYYNGTFKKIISILNCGYSCYVLTDQPDRFEEYKNVISIPYSRTIKSYHDKMILTKYILKDCDICILLDADIHIADCSFLDKLNNYNFKEGISYPFTLKNHKANIEFIKGLNFYSPEWRDYMLFAEKIIPDFKELPTIWENFLVINNKGFDYKFYETYEKLQIVKENSDLRFNKDVNGNGEGVSIMISAKNSNINIGQDLELLELVKDKIKDISRKFTRKELWEDWMR